MIEISFGAAAITSSIMEHYYVLSNFFAKAQNKNENNPKLKSIYKPSHHEGYNYILNVLKELKKVARKDIASLKPSKETTNKLRQLAQGKKAVSYYDDSIKAVFTVIPIINNITKKNIGFLTIRSKSQNIITSQNYIFTILFLVLTIFGLFFLFIYLLVHKKEILKKMVNEKTKELKILNQNLENKVEERTKKLNDFLNSSSDFAWEIDQNGIYTYASKGVKDILGYEPEEMIGKSPIDFLSLKEKKKINTKLKEILKEKKAFKYLENENLNKNGQIVSLLTSGVPVIENGKLLGYRGTDKDITKEKLIEKELKDKELILLEQSKLASMGEMLEAIAHQWRQPLSVITTTSSGVKIFKQMDMLDDEKLISSLDNIEKSARHLSDTIDDFRNFYKTDKDVKYFDLKASIEKAIELLQSKLSNKNINVELQIDYIQVKAFENEIIQVFMNILNNSIDAFESTKVEQKVIKIFLDDKLVENSKKLTVNFLDNAGGIPKKNLEKVFDNKFTTKGDKGTGIGLYMSKLITEKSHGSISVKNEEFTYENSLNKGACFQITLIK